jgi:hypothetical protein
MDLKVQNVMLLTLTNKFSVERTRRFIAAFTNPATRPYHEQIGTIQNPTSLSP